MQKIDFIYGFFIGISTAFIGAYLFMKIKTDFNFIEGIQIVYSQGILGKLITLGTILNVVVFFALLQFKKELMARGVVFATIILALITLFLQ